MRIKVKSSSYVVILVKELKIREELDAIVEVI